LAKSTNSTQTQSRGIAGAAGSFGYGGTADTSYGATSNIFGSLLGIFRPPKANPYAESGRMGTAVWGGFVQNIEKDPRLYGQNRYRTASDILANVSIVAAGLRFFLNLVAVPAWTVKPVEDMPHGQSSDEAKRLADFAQDCIEDLDTAWTRVVRRSGMFRFHGFGIQEWTARRREDGLIGLRDMEQRPQHTIERWELADDGTILGVWQRWPQNGQLLFIPREKVVYLVDDMMTDSPEGLGMFRHLVDPAERLRRYLKMEGIGYERDMRGLPMGRAPLAEINQQVANGTITKRQGEEAISAIRKFVQLQAKEVDSSLLVDSAAYIGPTSDGFTVSPVHKWDVELLKAGSAGFKELGDAIDRVTHDMARILGVETLLLGSHGQGSGSRALSEDKSRNLYLAVDSTVDDIAEGMRRDALGAIWMLNGLPRRLMPKLHTEDVAFKDVSSVAKALADMATAGAILAPDDPAINDVRDLLGISRQPQGDGAAAVAAAMLPRALPPKGGAVDPTGGQPPDGGTPPKPSGRSGRAINDGRPKGKIPTETSASHAPQPGPTPAAPGSPQTSGKTRNVTSSSTIR
jgi:hypothetical protein